MKIRKSLFVYLWIRASFSVLSNYNSHKQPVSVFNTLTCLTTCNDSKEGTKFTLMKSVALYKEAWHPRQAMMGVNYQILSSVQTLNGETFQMFTWIRMNKTFLWQPWGWSCEIDNGGGSKQGRMRVNSALCFLVITAIEARHQEVGSANDQEVCKKKNGETRLLDTSE